MSLPLRPDDYGNEIADIRRRLDALENAARMPNPSEMASTFQAVSGATFGAWEYAPAGATYVDTLTPGTVKAGYPQLTMFVPSLAIVTFGGRLEGLANVATSRSKAGTLGVQIDGLDGALVAGVTYQTNAGNYDVPQSTSVTLSLAKGTHTLKLGVFWENTVPAGANLPRLSNAFLIVTPQTIS